MGGGARGSPREKSRRARREPRRLLGWL